MCADRIDNSLINFLTDGSVKMWDSPGGMNGKGNPWVYDGLSKWGDSPEFSEDFAIFFCENW